MGFISVLRSSPSSKADIFTNDDIMEGVSSLQCYKNQEYSKIGESFDEK